MKSCLVFHDWSKWQTTGAGKVTSFGVVIGFYVRQERRCERCGKVRIRIEEAEA